MLSLILKSASVQRLIRSEANALYEEKVKADKERKLESHEVIADMSVGKPVIIIPDTDASISVGIITGFIQVDPAIPYVQDYIRDEKVVCFTNYIPYNEQNLKAVMKLTPDERGGVFYRCHQESEECYKAYAKGEKALSYEEIKEVIESTDFLEKAREYWAKD